MKKVSKITKSSILITLTIIILFTSKIFPTADLAILTLCSSIMCLSIIKLGTKYSFYIFISSTILSFIFGIINYGILYMIFFGIYPIIKFYIEKQNKILIEIGLKSLFFIPLSIISSIVFIFLFSKIEPSIPIILLMALSSNIFLFIYDFCLIFIIRYIYHNKFFKNI